MKNLTTLLFLLLFIKLSVAQNTCEKKEQTEIQDLNAISVNKCEIEVTKNNSRKVSTKIKTSRKRITNRFKRVSKNKRNSLTGIKSSEIKIVSNNPLNTPPINNLSKNVLFSIVEEVPMFPKCKIGPKQENIKCFKESINNHFNKNIHVEKIADENIPKRILVQITIGIDGKITNSKIISKNKKITKELKRVISKIPNLIPGREQNIPVNVTYSFPINLTLN
ncbi:hypothetical protein [Tenacibaculum holothuriorum]|uniref:hypothetical protein n=1 Tax=Tenacibaculum holothuriorum TaxID=1635173 RepID=UPI000A31F079|nr:hypothetical protein [Tenacibaculum holothuriorum]